jgi:hypothetical protein
MFEFLLLLVLDSLLRSCFNVGCYCGGVGSSCSPSGISGINSRPVAVVVNQYNSDVRFASIFFNNLDLIDLSKHRYPLTSTRSLLTSNSCL